MGDCFGTVVILMFIIIVAGAPVLRGLAWAINHLGDGMRAMFGS